MLSGASARGKFGYNTYPASDPPASTTSTAPVTLPRHAAADRFRRLCLFALATCCLALCRESLADEPLEPRATMDDALAPFVAQYCADCHSGDEAEAGLNVERLLEAPSVPHRRREWEKVLQRMQAGEMPPEEGLQPEPAERDAVLAWLAAELTAPDCSQPHPPGRVVLRRLNRQEYQNTVRDLTGVDFDAAAMFPRDELGHGFDNNADVQTLPPVLLEKYLLAAEQIAEQAIVTPESILEPTQTFPAGELHGGDEAAPGARGLYTNGRIWAEGHAEQPGAYLLRARVYATQAGNEPAKVALQVGDKRLRTFDVEVGQGDPQTFLAAFDAQAGPLTVGVELLNDYWDPDHPDEGRRDRNLYVESLVIVGPIVDFRPDRLPRGHRELLPWTPSAVQWQSPKKWREPTRELIARLLMRAYRRPPTAAEIDRLAELVVQSRDRGDSFERSMQLVLQATLASPQFLFRGESVANDKGGKAQGKDKPAVVRDLDDFQLASRLSYFLWSTMPDGELLKHAAAGTLRNNLDAQVDRLLASPRADELIRNFGEQWLQVRGVENIERDGAQFPDFDAQLADAFRQETFLLLRNIILNDRPLTELVAADYTFVNARLAEHYGLPTPEGDEFQRVELPRERRAGVLTHGSVLAVTSHEDRTSPVLRGKWVLSQLLADAPPPPPPGLPGIPEAEGEHAGKSLRERLAVHREDPSCAVCHDRMDPLGLAMENFDAVGRWREFDGENKIDSAGELPDGRKLAGPAGLRDVLLADFARVRRCLAEKLLVYALGRGLEPTDDCAILQIVADAESGGDTFAAMVRGVVHSTPFLQQSSER
jgi:mono/diheme cytochrome c family protein